jgi:hypothetical protein
MLKLVRISISVREASKLSSFVGFSHYAVAMWLIPLTEAICVVCRFVVGLSLLFCLWYW